ncbi:MAG: family N-acetyltransferase [Acidimicrobiales bacterium]|nr:family N-acetyltransferase [Acidimicrobiales bacterium]
MIVRDATPDDLGEIAALIRELAEFEQLAHEVVWDVDGLGDQLFGPDAVPRVLLVEVDGRVGGMALWFPTFSTFLGRSGIWLEDLFVRAELRGNGAGRALIQALRDRTDGRVEWNVLDWNERAIGFYESLGARPLGGWTTYRWTP